MISVADAFSVEEVDSVRKIAESVQFAWKKDTSNNRFFTIGVSTIGGNDLIPGPAAAATAWTKYRYEDESAYALALEYERELNMPLGGLVKSLADIKLDNTSGRFSPRYTGGSSAIFTAVGLPGRPVIINAGFNYGGIDNVIPQFVGLTSKPARVDSRNREVDISASDFIEYIQDSYVDKTSMFTTEFTDVLLQQSFQTLGFSTSQYDLDQGINRVKFGIFETGQKWGNYVNQLVQAENGHLYQDEQGVIKFENRQHYSTFPYFNIQRIITTAQVINAVVPDTDHIINVVEVKGSPRSVQTTQLVWQATGYAGSGVITLAASTNTEVWINFNDPMFAITTPVANGTSGQTSYFKANTKSDDTGTDVTSSVSVKSIDNFAQTTKLVFTNGTSDQAFLTTLDIWGRPARKTGDVYYKTKRDISVTAFGERPIMIQNDYIQDSSWAQSLAELVLRDFALPENLQTLIIRAIPELQMGDLISWQGHYWRVFGIKTQLDPGVGFIQELKLLQRTIVTYFRIGISTIGGSDQIAP